MVKSFALIDNVWFEKSVKFPYKLTSSLIIHKLYEGKFWYQNRIRDWELKNKHSVGYYPYVIEIKNTHQTNDSQLVYGINNIITIIRLVTYNRIHLDYVVCFDENGKITSSYSPDKRHPSSFIAVHKPMGNATLEKVKETIKKIKLLATKDNQRILRSLYFWNSSACSETFEIKVIELFTALESLFTTSSEEITFKLSSRLAWLNEKTNKRKRQILFNEVKEGYGIRSKIVHGKKFLESTELPLIQKLHAYTREVLLKTIFDKKLRDLFTAENKILEGYFGKLVMGQ